MNIKKWITSFIVSSLLFNSAGIPVWAEENNSSVVEDGVTMDKVEEYLEEAGYPKRVH